MFCFRRRFINLHGLSCIMRLLVELVFLRVNLLLIRSVVKFLRGMGVTIALPLLAESLGRFRDAAAPLLVSLDPPSTAATATATTPAAPPVAATRPGPVADARYRTSVN